MNVRLLGYSINPYYNVQFDYVKRYIYRAIYNNENMCKTTPIEACNVRHITLYLYTEGEIIMMPLPVNYLATLVAALANWGIGMLWYSPVLFGNAWMNLSKIDPKKMDMKKEMPKIAIIGLLAAYISAVVLSLLIDMTVSTTVIEGMTLGFWVWLGFAATVLVNSVLYEKKPWSLYIINSGYLFVAYMVMGAILVLWP